MAVPGAPPAAVLATLVEKGLNSYLSQDEEVRARLLDMEGRVIALDLVGFGVSLHVRPRGDRVEVTDSYSGTPDVTLRGTLPNLARSAMDPMSETSLEVIGDVGLGQRFQQLLADVEPDWEEKLSAVVGDVAAHQLGRLFRGARAWGEETRRAWEANVGEYLQEERRDVPATAELAYFIKGVDEVRSDLDRLEARVRRLRSLARTSSE